MRVPLVLRDLLLELRQLTTYVGAMVPAPPQPVPRVSQRQGTQAEPSGVMRHPAPIPQSVVGSQPMREQNHWSWPTAARHSPAYG